jgi:hypothetical protein
VFARVDQTLPVIAALPILRMTAGRQVNRDVNEEESFVMIGWVQFRCYSEKNCKTPHARMEYTVHSTQYAVHSTQYTVRSTQYTVHSTQYAVRSTQYTVRSTQYTVRSTQYTVHRQDVALLLVRADSAISWIWSFVSEAGIV